MPPDPELIRALRAAVERDPESLALRLHLAGMLLELGAEGEALEQYVHVLAREPANVDALRGAQRAAEAAGDAARADGYRRLADALSGRPAADEAPDATPAGAREEPLATRSDPLKPDWWDAEFPTLKLTDVGGMEEVKRRLNVAFLGPLRNPEVLRAYGRALRGGL